MVKRKFLLTFWMIALMLSIAVSPGVTLAPYSSPLYPVDSLYNGLKKPVLIKNDTTPPQVVYSNATPVNQDMYGHVNLTALVTDDVGIAFVNVTIFFPDITQRNETMININGSDLYFYNTTYSLPGTYIFQIWGVDLNGNINHDCCPNFFVIRDILPPTIHSVVATPLNQESGRNITFSAEVTDNVGVDEVQINITGPTGFSRTGIMLQIPDTETYYLTLQFWELGVYTFTVKANDDEENSNTSVLNTFTILPLNHESHFNEEWNLISLPIQNTWSAESLGQNISGSTIISLFEGDTQGFITHVIGSPWDDFPLNEGSGFFVYTIINNTLSMSGTAIHNLTFTIYPSWNALGWFNSSATTAESLGQNITGCSLVLMFDSSTQTFKTHVVGTPWENFNIVQGMGLFIYTTASSIWHGQG